MNTTNTCHIKTWFLSPVSSLPKLFYNSDNTHYNYYSHKQQPKYTCADCIHQFTHKLTGDCNKKYEKK